MKSETDKQNSSTRQCFLKHLVFIIILNLVTAICYSSAGVSTIGQADTIIQKTQASSLHVLKCSPQRLLFGELPFSWELFLNNKKSIQIQVGVLFPYFKKAPVISIFPEPSSDMVSCRNMPYIDNGISSKIEFRKYRKMGYFSFQGMYKHSSYTDISFTIWEVRSGYESYDQIESRTSNIFGLGFMAGIENYQRGFVTDIYAGLGIRLRMTEGVVSARMYGNPLGRVETYEPFDYSSVYPFFNIGIRFGKTIRIKHKPPVEAWQEMPGY
jgi:hypothetical protein